MGGRRSGVGIGDLAPTARLVANCRPVILADDQCIVGTDELAALRAERDALAARVAQLEATLFRGHTWERQGREYRCETCGLRTLYPMRVEFSCAEWKAGRSVKRGRYARRGGE